MRSVASSLAVRIFSKDARLRPLFRVLLFLAVAFVAVSVADDAAASLAFLKPVRGAWLPPAMAYPLVERTLVCIVLVALVMLFRARLDRRSVASLGFSFRAPWLRLTVLGAVLGAGMQALIVAADRASGAGRLLVSGSPSSIAETLAIFVPLFFVSAIAEELPIRGYVLQNAWEAWGFVPAITASGVLFVLLHLGNPHSHAQLGLTVAGLAGYSVWTGLSLYWTRSLWVAFGSHVAWNVFEGPVFGFPVSGFEFPGKTVFAANVGGPTWFTGGGFGPEAGVSGLAAMAIGLALLYLCFRLGAFARVPDERESYAKGRT